MATPKDSTPLADSISLDRLRGHRSPEGRHAGIAEAVGGQLSFLTRRSRGLGAVVSAWEASAPPHVRDACEIVSCARGVLTVRTDGRAAVYTIDRWWRSEGARAMQSHGGAGARKLKVVTA